MGKIMFKRFVPPAFIVIGLAACGQATPTKTGDGPAPAIEAEAGSLADTGREIAERNCATCHSIERAGASPLAEAPPLRVALVDFDIEALATDFREHIKVGNEVMPKFDFSPLHTDALMAYLSTIEDVSDVE